ncbi:MAG: TIGR02186 family protein [Sphingomonadales bacterium]|nr:TIGR02186 family protein [Sphingomonadales bacterium]
MRRLLLLAGLVLLTGARDPILVPDVSQHQIEVRQGFTGTELLLFGAILDPAGTRAGGDYDIVVVVEGPTQPVVLRQKRRVAGVWINADSTTWRSVPSYYAVASSRPLEKIVDPRTAAIYEFGLDSLQLSPTGAIDPAAQERFSGGLVDLMRRHGLYSQDDNGVTLTGQVLYRARIFLPSSVQVGTYTAETFAVRKGRVVASALAHVEVKKLGLERAIARFAIHYAFFYGLMAVTVSVAMGWLAGRLFALA